MTDRPDFSELIKSLYDDDRSPRSGSGSWLVVPLVALALGVGAGWMVGGGGATVNDPVSIDTTTTAVTTETPREQADGFPEGYTEITSDIAMRTLTTYEIQDQTYAVVASVTRGDVDRSSVFQQSFASWALDQSGGEVAMASQAATADPPGMFQVRFPAALEPGATLTGVPGEPSDPMTIRLLDDAPTELVMEEPIVVDADGTEVTIDFLEYDLQVGYAVWHTAPDAPATVEIIITLVGTEGFGNVDSLPYRVGSFESWATFLGEDVRADVPQWSTGGELRLNRAGAFRLDRDAIETITVDAVVTLATDLVEPVSIPVD